MSGAFTDAFQAFRSTSVRRRLGDGTMKKRLALAGLAVAGGVGLLVAAGPATSNEEPSNCYVVIPSRANTQPPPDEAGREPTFCFDTTKQLHEAEREAGLRD